MIANLYVMCGLQGSGKSTEAKKLVSENKWVLLSSDEMRKEFPDKDNEFIFNKLYERMNEHLSKAESVVIDATNTTIKSRKHILDNVKHECYKLCYIMNTPFNICLERVRNRNNKPNAHNVPEDVVRKYYESFEIPFYEEGWDSIIFYNTLPERFSRLYLKQLKEKSKDFDQKNKHHTQLLGAHMDNVRAYMEDKTTDKVLKLAGEYHDVGKLFTQTFKDGDENAHYYNHANVGAYNLMCYIYDIGERYWDYWRNDAPLRFLFYINYHMKMHDIKKDKDIAKWRKIFGGDKYDRLKLLYDADCFRGDVEELKREETKDDKTPQFYTLTTDCVKPYISAPSQHIDIGTINSVPYFTYDEKHFEPDPVDLTEYFQELYWARGGDDQC